MTTELLDELRAAMDTQTAGVYLSSDAAERALRGARRRRRRHVLVSSVSVALAAVLTGLSLAAVTAGAPQRLQTADPNHPTTAPSSQQLDAAVVAALFPVSGADFTFDATHGLRAFDDAVLRHDVDTCLASKGVAATPAAAPVAPHINDFPDLTSIASQGLSGPPVKAAAPGSPLGQCERSAAKTRTAVLAIQRDPVVSAWMDKATAVDTGPQVVAAYRSFGPCAQAHGVPATSEDAFFSYADAHLQQAATAAQARTLDLRLGAVYATCMQPIETVRVGLRTHLRETFLRAHAAQVSRIEMQAADAVARVERDTGVSWPG